MVSPCRSGSVARMPTRRRINDEDQGQLTLLSATAAVHGLSVLGQSVAAQRGGGLRQEGFLLGLAALASLDFTGGMPAPLVRRGFVQSCFLLVVLFANQGICFLSVCIIFSFDLHADDVTGVVPVGKVFKPLAIAPKLSLLV